MIGRTLTTADARAWQEAMPASRCVFASLGFARAQESRGDRCRLVTVTGEGVDLAYPVTLRDIPSGPGNTVGGWDASTPPFTGPVLREPVDADRSARAGELVEEQVRALGPVTEFAHIHPWRPGRDVLEAGHLEVGRDLVFVDTTARDHELDPDYTRACRKNIRRAQELGVTVREATTDEDLDAFHRIYSATMARREALPAYRYPLDYFERIRSELRSHARFVLAELAGQVVAATLYLCDDEDVYSFLGGSEMAHQHARPTNLLVHETIRWAHETGRLRLVLGGGYRPGDGIERFKAGFSPLRMKLPTFRRVHDQAKYDELLALWVQERGPLVSDYFPPYRADEVTRVVAGAPGHKP